MPLTGILSPVTITVRLSGIVVRGYVYHAADPGSIPDEGFLFVWHCIFCQTVAHVSSSNATFFPVVM